MPFEFASLSMSVLLCNIIGFMIKITIVCILTDYMSVSIFLKGDRTYEKIPWVETFWTIHDMVLL